MEVLKSVLYNVWFYFICVVLAGGGIYGNIVLPSEIHRYSPTQRGSARIFPPYAAYIGVREFFRNRRIPEEVREELDRCYTVLERAGATRKDRVAVCECNLIEKIDIDMCGERVFASSKGAG